MIETFDKVMTIISAVIVIVAVIAGVFTIINRCDNKQIIKDNTTIEKTNYSNDSLRIELKHIDKDKNEKIIEVKGLNNDSTYKLFKRLIAE